MTRKWKPDARVPGCEHGNRPTKAEQGTGGVKLTARGMGVARKAPCSECPLRRDSAPGYLGGYTPEMYLEVMASPASIACHNSRGFQEGRLEDQRHCTGIAAFRANVGHICQMRGHTTAAHQSTQAVGSDTDTYFATAEEFAAHHREGQR